MLGAPSRASQDFARCSPAVTIAGSNCGNGVTLAAPGEDVLAQTSWVTPSSAVFSGTSAAAPIVNRNRRNAPGHPPHRATADAIANLIDGRAAPLPISPVRGMTTRWFVSTRSPRLKPSCRVNVGSVLYRGPGGAVGELRQRAGGRRRRHSITAKPITGSSASQAIALTVTSRGQTITAGHTALHRPDSKRPPSVCAGVGRRAVGGRPRGHRHPHQTSRSTSFLSRERVFLLSPARPARRRCNSGNPTLHRWHLVTADSLRLDRLHHRRSTPPDGRSSSVTLTCPARIER